MSHNHFVAAACGFGVRVTPLPGAFRLRCSGSALELERQHAGEWRSTTVTPTKAELGSALSTLATDLSGVAQVEPGPSSEGWWLETSSYRFPLPTSWVVRSSGDRKASPLLELVDIAGSSIFVRTPRRMPALESLQGPGHQFRDIGQAARAGWIEFDFVDEGRAWLQRHELFHRGMAPFVVTLQAPVDRAGACMSTLASIVEQLELPAERT